MKIENISLFRTPLLALWLLVSLALPTYGQDVQTAIPNGDLINDLADSHPASAYVDGSTVLAAQFDWGKIDLDAMLQLIQQFSGDAPADTASLNPMVDQLKAAKAEQILVVAGLESLADGSPLIIIPTPQATALHQQWVSVFHDAVQVAPNGSAVLLGSPNQLGKYQNFTPTRRSELLLPLRDANRLDHTIVVTLPAAARDLLGKLWPTNEATEIPTGFTPTQLIPAVQRLVVSFQTPPDSLIHAQIETSDVAAAERMRDSIQQLAQRTADELPGITIKQTERLVSLDIDQRGIEQLAKIAVQSRRSAGRSELVNTMKQCGLAFYNYESREKHLPPRCFVDPTGKPLHSWLVAVLPDFDQLAFYKSIRLDRAWNDAENEHLIQTVPAGVGSQSLPVGHTVLRAPVFPGSLWQGDGPPKRLRDITDGTANTIMLVEAPVEASIHWADPTPWVISADDPIKDLFGNRKDAHVLLADGSVKLLKRAELDNAKLKAMLTIAAAD